MLSTLLAALSLASTPQITSPDPVFSAEPNIDRAATIVDIAPTPDGGAILAVTVDSLGSVPVLAGQYRVAADGSVTWRRLVGTNGSSPSRALGAALDDEGGAFLLWRIDRVTDPSALVSQFAAQGTIRRSFNLGFVFFPADTRRSRSAPRAMVEDGTGRAWIGGSIATVNATEQFRARLLRWVDDDTPMLETAPFGPQAATVQLLDRLPTGDLIALVGDTTGELRLMRLDQTQATTWSVPITPAAGGSRPVAIALGVDGGIHLAFDSPTDPTGADEPDEIIKVDGANGDILWTRPLRLPIGGVDVDDLAAMPDGSLMVAGGLDGAGQAAGVLQRLRADGSPAEHQTYDNLTPGSATARIRRIVRSGGGWLVAAEPVGTTAPGQVVRSFYGRLADPAEVGQPYCGPSLVNSTGLPGVTRAFGSTSAADNSLVLRSQDLPAGVMGLYIVGRQQGQQPILGGSLGRLCLEGFIGRLTDSMGSTALDGTASHVVDLSALPTITGPAPAMAGEQWNFQFWHRDDPAFSNSNATAAVTVILD